MLRVSHFAFVERVAVKTCPALGAVALLAVTVPVPVFTFSAVLVLVLIHFEEVESYAST